MVTCNSIKSENRRELSSLKKQNIYCKEQIRNKDNALWVKKEYHQVLKNNLQRIKDIESHNKKLDRLCEK